MKNRTMKPWTADRSWFPCALTVGNGLCGLFAILYTLRQPLFEGTDPRLPVLFLCMAILFDSLDGFVARKLKAESLHGMQLDSLSDLISFGIAPAVLLFTVVQGGRPDASPHSWLPWASAGCYTICAMWRLAHYNTLALTETEHKEGFVGLPSPAAALMLCSILLLVQRFDPSARSTFYIPVVYAFILSFLMVSEFHYLHGKQIIKMGSLPVRLLMLALALLLCKYQGFYGYLLLIHIYLLSAPLLGIIEKRMALLTEQNDSVQI